MIALGILGNFFGFILTGCIYAAIILGVIWFFYTILKGSFTKSPEEEREDFYDYFTKDMLIGMGQEKKHKALNNAIEHAVFSDGYIASIAKQFKKIWGENINIEIGNVDQALKDDTFIEKYEKTRKDNENPLNPLRRSLLESHSPLAFCQHFIRSTTEGKLKDLATEEAEMESVNGHKRYTVLCDRYEYYDRKIVLHLQDAYGEVYSEPLTGISAMYELFEGRLLLVDMKICEYTAEGEHYFRGMIKNIIVTPVCYDAKGKKLYPAKNTKSYWQRLVFKKGQYIPCDVKKQANVKRTSRYDEESTDEYYVHQYYENDPKSPFISEDLVWYEQLMKDAYRYQPKVPGAPGPCHYHSHQKPFIS